MNLKSLRPKRPTNLVSLTHILQVQNAKEAALPGALPEPLLLSVARDLRSMDQPAGDAEAEINIAAPLMLVLCILMGGARPGSAEFSVSEAVLHDSLRLYQWAVEREIVTRITGLGGDSDSETLLSKLETMRVAAANEA